MPRHGENEEKKEEEEPIITDRASHGPQLCPLPLGHTAGLQSQFPHMWLNSGQGNVNQSDVGHF